MIINTKISKLKQNQGWFKFGYCLLQKFINLLIMIINTKMVKKNKIIVGLNFDIIYCYNLFKRNNLAKDNIHEVNININLIFVKQKII